MSASGRSTLRITGIAALAALTVSLLAGCTSGGSSGGSGGSVASGGGSSGEAPARDQAGDAAGKGKAVTGADRSVVRTGSLDLTAKDPVQAAANITRIVIGGGGRIENVVEQPTQDASSSLTARIPSEVFDRTLAAIRREGTVRNVSVRAADVSSRVTNYAVRIGSLRTSIQRLQALLAKASTTTDLVQIESTLTSRETDLEQLLAEQKGLEDQVSYGTLAITVQEPSLARNPAPSNFFTGFLAGFNALVEVGAGLVVGLGVVLPWLLALGALGGLVLLGVRSVQRIRRRRPVTPA